MRRIQHTDMDGTFTESVEPSPNLPTAIAEAMERISVGYEATLAKGINAGGIVIDGSDAGQTTMSKSVTLLQLGVTIGQLTPESQAPPIADVHGQLHPLTVAQTFAISFQYGHAIIALRATKIALEATASAAETIEAADAIEWGA